MWVVQIQNCISAIESILPWPLMFISLLKVELFNMLIFTLIKGQSETLPQSSGIKTELAFPSTVVLDFT